MRGLLLGAALIGGGGFYVASSGASNSDLVRAVNATPYQTWKGYNLIFNDYGSALYEFNGDTGGGWGSDRPRPVVTSVDGKSIDYQLQYQGQPVARLKIDFDPVANGSQTKLSMRFESVQTPWKPGQPITSLRPNPFFALAMRNVVDKVDRHIENGEVDKAVEAFSQMRMRMQSDPELAAARRAEQDYRQRKAMRDASKPALDPDAAAMKPHGSTVLPGEYD